MVRVHFDNGEVLTVKNASLNSMSNGINNIAYEENSNGVRYVSDDVEGRLINIDKITYIEEVEETEAENERVNNG